MALVLVVLAAALVAGRLRGGRPSRLGALVLRDKRLVLLALLVQLLGALLGGPAYALGLAGSAALVLLFLGRNRGLAGCAVVAGGLLLNALVVGLNGAMPVDEAAARRAGADLSLVRAGLDPRHELAGAGTRLRLLGDVVPVPLPAAREVVSPGDVLVAVGIGQLVLAGTTGPARQRAGGGPVRPAARPHLPPLPARRRRGALALRPRRPPARPRR